METYTSEQQQEQESPASSSPASASKTASKVQQLATSQIDSQKGKIADVLQSTGSAIRQAGQGLREQGQQGLSELADQGATKVDSFSSYLRETDGQALIGKAQETARKQPVLIAGAGFTLAFIAARFLRGSGSQATQPAQEAAPATAPPAELPEDFAPLPPEPTQDPIVALLEEAPKARRRRARDTAEPPA